MMRIMGRLSILDTVAGRFKEYDTLPEDPKPGMWAVVNEEMFVSMEDDTGHGEWIQLTNEDELWVGIPVPWPFTQIPEDFLEARGQMFDKNEFPDLARMYPSGRLPDLRGEFIRGLDNGRGVDSGRNILSHQQDALQGHIHYTSFDGNYRYATDKNAGDGSRKYGYDAARNSKTADAMRTSEPIADRQGNGTPRTAKETRPRNVAFLYIIRARR